MVDDRFNDLKKLLDIQPEDVELNFTDCVKHVNDCFADLSPCQRERLLGMILVHLDSCETDELTQSLKNTPTAVKLKIKLIFAFECRRVCASSPEVAPDLQLSDWVSNVVGRLGVCIPDRRQWKQFLESEIVSRYSELFAFTLSEVYLNLGLDPPDSLPKYTDLNASGSFNIEPQDDGHSPLFQERSPVCQTSPPCPRLAVRQFLPRAMFSDSVAIVSAASLTPLSKRATADGYPAASGRGSQALLSSSSRATTRTTTVLQVSSCSTRQSVGHSSLSALPSTSSALTVTPKLVLIPSSRSRRRKGRTPTKRIAGIRRKAKGVDPASGTPATAAAAAAAAAASSNSRSRSKSLRDAGDMVVSGRHSSREDGKSSSSSRRSHRRACPARPGGQEEQPVGQVTPKNRHRSYRRSVHETPNPDKSFPRWERALLAAAEKTKSKAIIVQESPIKPSTSFDSPLRRLRRANSLLVSLPHLQSSARLTSSQPIAEEDGPVGGGTPRDRTAAQPTGCLSLGMTRAERWLQRQFDEETSLSQFSHSSPARGQQKESPVGGGPGVVLSQHTPSSGLLSVGPRDGGWAVHRRSSNLFANMVSPEALVRSPPNGTPRKRMAAAQEKQNQSPPLQPSTPIRTLPRHHYKPSQSSHIDRRHPLSGSTLLTATRTPPASSRDIPCSPQVFDEDAMFLGREEFLTRTSNTTPSVAGTPARSHLDVDHVEAEESENTGSPSLRKRCRLSPASSLSPLLPPVFRLTRRRSPEGVAGWAPASVSPDKSHSPGLRGHPRRITLARLRASPTVPRPGRSPLAPLHLYTCPSLRACDGDTETAQSNSQTASHLVAMRTRLFGGSNTNSNDTDVENVNPAGQAPPVPRRSLFQ